MMGNFRLLSEYYRIHGFKSTIQFIVGIISDKIAKHKQLSKCSDFKKRTVLGDPSAPIIVYMIPNVRMCSRITVIADSVSHGALDAVIGSAILFGALLAESRQSCLRIITRLEQINPLDIGRLFRFNKISLTHDIEFVFSPPGFPEEEFDIFEDELFIPTSLDTERATFNSICKKMIVDFPFDAKTPLDVIQQHVREFNGHLS
ncbi:MAG: hypothetical protein ACHQAX_07540 [Gammaproteobacteria bacterium]